MPHINKHAIVCDRKEVSERANLELSVGDSPAFLGVEELECHADLILLVIGEEVGRARRCDELASMCPGTIHMAATTMVLVLVMVMGRHLATIIHLTMVWCYILLWMMMLLVNLLLLVLLMGA